MNAPLNLNVPMGLVEGLSIEAYHAGEGLSKSGLDDLARCPLIFKALRSPDAPERAATSSQLHGNLAHCAILEPAEFTKRYSVHPVMNRNLKAWHAIADACPVGVTPIQTDQCDTAVAQAKSVRALKNVWGDMPMSALLAKGKPEVSAYWADPETGILCRCRPDWVHPLNDKEVVLIDVKTFSNASPREFSKQVSRMRYFVQDAFYSDGYSIASGQLVKAFIFVVVEDKYPYAAAAYQLGEESRWEGVQEYRRLVDLYAECKHTDTWPGYSDRTVVVDLPPYALSSQEIEISYVP